MTYEPWPQEKGTKGLAILVTNCDNEKPKKPLGKDWVPRDFLAGTIHDHSKWMTALTKLNFDIRWERNLDRNLMINFLKTVSSIDLNPGCEYVIFVFCGHGGEGVIYAQDGEELSLKDNVFPPFFQGNMSGLKKLFFIDACRQEPADKSPTLTQALFGPGEYFALCPVPYGREAADYSGGSPFSEVVARYIVEDISLAEVVQKVCKSLREMAQKNKVQNELVTEISTLQTSPRLASRGSKPDMGDNQPDGAIQVKKPTSTVPDVLKEKIRKHKGYQKILTNKVAIHTHHLKALSINLGVESGRFIAKNPTDMENALVELLIHWADGNTGKTPIWSDLLKAMKESKMAKEADELEEYLRGGNS